MTGDFVPVRADSGVGPFIDLWGIKLSIRNLQSAKITSDRSLVMEFTTGEKVTLTGAAPAMIGLFDLAAVNSYLAKICQNRELIACR